ncbi:hypothetical protein [Clostridium sp. AM58-1XD]|uniref:hypothetical protein n=1 Tax=Clostridium sp. AM58-1XD TaxID=2292307 RepID=UPI000E54C8DF|nr:hypothetical protein [Clostridium sp. AM58-1XD]RGY99469.1 hypothetical protein DXA13_08180 [Clostridium sp. AM58-1XD]
MTLKNWFSKFMIEDTKRRLWAVALVTLLFFFSFPVATVFVAGTRYSQDRIEWLRSFSRIMLTFVSKQNLWVAFIIVVLAIVCGVSGFSYLDSKKKVDFYHSIPIKREKIFAVNYLNGILIVAAPYFINVMISAAVAVTQGVSPAIFGEAFKGWAYFMTYYLMIYATVVIAVVMTGNLIVGLLGTGVFFFYGPMVLLLTEGYFSTWFYSYYDSGQFIEHVGNVSPFINYCIGGTPTWTFFASHLAAGLILSVIALLLYRKRPSEAAGKAMAFSISKPIIRILIVMLSALGGALFFWGMRGNIGWAVFGLITGCLIAHCVIEIIYNFDFKKLFSHYKQMIGCFVVSLIVLCVFRYDLVGFDRYIPKESQVASAAVSISDLDDWLDYGELAPFHKPEEDYEELILNQWLGVEQFPGRPFMWESESRDDHLSEK